MNMSFVPFWTLNDLLVTGKVTVILDYCQPLRYALNVYRRLMSWLTGCTIT